MASHVPFSCWVFLFLKGDVSMRFHSGRLVLAASALFILSGALARAQTGTTDESKGKVKTEVVIGADGRVKTTRVVGGHPLLVHACQDAVREWRFLPAPEETTQVVEFEFRADE